jgi:nitrite reductase/ring-hydroxylating ferredoxin subunit
MTTLPTTAWHRVDEVPDEGRVRTAVVDGRSVALTRCAGRVGALENHCPHQGGPLGEGSIENGWLRCPWHGYDYDPTTGRPPEGFSDAPVAFGVEERADGTYVELPVVPERPRSVSDVLVETLVATSPARSSSNCSPSISKTPSRPTRSPRSTSTWPTATPASATCTRCARPSPHWAWCPPNGSPRRSPSRRSTPSWTSSANGGDGYQGCLTRVARV